MRCPHKKELGEDRGTLQVELVLVHQRASHLGFADLRGLLHPRLVPVEGLGDLGDRDAQVEQFRRSCGTLARRKGQSLVVRHHLGDHPLGGACSLVLGGVQVHDHRHRFRADLTSGECAPLTISHDNPSVGVLDRADRFEHPVVADRFHELGRRGQVDLVSDVGTDLERVRVEPNEDFAVDDLGDGTVLNCSHGDLSPRIRIQDTGQISAARCLVFSGGAVSVSWSRTRHGPEGR